MEAIVELGNAFYSEGPPMYQRSPVNNRYLDTTTNLTPRQNRALAILHKFAHALGLIHVMVLKQIRRERKARRIL